MSDPADTLDTPQADPLAIGQESSLSNWAGDYVTDMLGKGWALSDMDYSAYMGPLTAGTTPLQEQAFQGIAGLAVPNNDSSDVLSQYGDNISQYGDNISQYGDDMANMDYSAETLDFNRWNNDWANQYMNPFLEQVLNSEMDELRRQADITRLNDASRLTKAGAFGGGRQAVMESELNDDTARLMNEVVGKGYRDAYDTAFSGFKSDEGRRLDTYKANQDDRQFDARFGLDALIAAADAERNAADAKRNAAEAERNAANIERNAADLTDRDFRNQLDLLREQERMGSIDRDILQQGIDADMKQFEEERDHPFEMTQYMQSLLQGMPLAAENSQYTQPSAFETFLGTAGAAGDTIDQILDMLGIG